MKLSLLDYKIYIYILGVICAKHHIKNGFWYLYVIIIIRPSSINRPSLCSLSLGRALLLPKSIFQANPNLVFVNANTTKIKKIIKIKFSFCPSSGLLRARYRIMIFIYLFFFQRHSLLVHSNFNPASILSDPSQPKKHRNKNQGFGYYKDRRLSRLPPNLLCCLLLLLLLQRSIEAR